MTKDRCEQSVIDIIMFSNDLNNHLVSVHIYEERKHVLTKIHKTKNGVRMNESDYNTIITKFDIKAMPKPHEKKNEIYNLKDKDGQLKFKEHTSKGKFLSSIFDSSETIDDLTDRLVEKINGCVSMSFKKIRVSDRKKEEKETLLDRMRELKGKTDLKSKNELKNVVKEIAERADIISTI